MDELHLLLLLSGLCSLSSCELHYEFFKDAKTWDEARSHCREKHGDLATMYNLKQMQTAFEAVEEKYKQDVWIGLHTRTTLNWHWSLALEDFYKEGEKDYLKWGRESNFNCGSYRNGLLHALSCSEVFPPVCFDVTKQGLDQYVLISKTMTWREARVHCRTQHTDLVSVRNEKENQILQEVVGNQTVWTGLFRDPWTWSDERNSSFRYWPTNQGVYTSGQLKLCVTVRADGRWEQRNCTQKHRFLCSYEKTYMQIYKVKISLEKSNLDPNDPTVKEDILKHIKQQLKGTSVEGVRWKTQPDGRVFRKEEPKKQDGYECEPE